MSVLGLGKLRSWNSVRVCVGVYRLDIQSGASLLRILYMNKPLLYTSCLCRLIILISVNFWLVVRVRNREADRQTCRRRDRQTDRQRNRERQRQRDRDRQTDRQAGRPAGR